jgi:hypothetical protein
MDDLLVVAVQYLPFAAAALWEWKRPPGKRTLLHLSW